MTMLYPKAAGKKGRASRHHKSTYRCEFPQKVREEIRARDGGCFFCMRGYHMEAVDRYGYSIPEIMLIVPRSALGLGVKENGVLGCRYHHALMDNGNKGLHSEMIEMLEGYMCDLYPGWDRESVTYHKYDH